jgi:hypothetical protein
VQSLDEMESATRNQLAAAWTRLAAMAGLLAALLASASSAGAAFSGASRGRCVA